MGKVVIVWIIFFIVLLGVGIFMYYYVEKPKIQSNSLINLSILAIDSSTGDKMEVNYTVLVDELFYSSGITDKYGAIFSQVPTNTTITVFNNPSNNGDYYIDVHNISLINVSNPYRVSLDLDSPGELEIEQIGIFGDDNVKLKLSTEGRIKNIGICLKWSLHFIYVKPLNFTEIDKINGYDRCFTFRTLENNSTRIKMDYKIFGRFDNGDFLNISFFDEDYSPMQINPKRTFRWEFSGILDK